MDNNGITIGKDSSGTITVTFRYDPDLVEKTKTVPGHRWHPDKKHWSFPDSDGTLEKILKTFEGEDIQIDPALQLQLSKPVTTKTPITIPSLRGTKSSGNLTHNFDDLKRELLSRKYSYKTVKGYLYYNRDFLNFIKKQPLDVSDSDIKDYLLYLAEEKQSATATLNQAINALKFYYGSMLKKKFLHEIKRPRKDKKLPVVLSQEEVAKILSSPDNIKHKAILILVYSAGLRVVSSFKHLQPKLRHLNYSYLAFSEVV